MAAHNCENCKFRAKYDDNPASFLGRIWRWHAGWVSRVEKVHHNLFLQMKGVYWLISMI